MIGDASGVSNAFLPGFFEIVEGDSLVLFNGRAEVVNEHIEIQGGISGGRIEKSRRPVEKVNEELNISDKAWVPME